MDYLMPSFHLGELFLRGTVTYLGLMLLFRIVGRREANGMVSVILQQPQQTSDSPKRPGL